MGKQNKGFGQKHINNRKSKKKLGCSLNTELKLVFSLKVSIFVLPEFLCSVYFVDFVRGNQAMDWYY